MFLLLSMVWAGLDHVTKTQLLAGESNVQNMKLNSDDEHVVCLHAQSEDD